MQRKVSFAFLAIALGLSLSIHSSAKAEEGMKDKMEDTGREMKTGAKKGLRAMKDKTCEMVDGKMQCAGKKMKHKMENGVDTVKDKVHEETK